MSVTMIGFDTAKSVFQVHAVDGSGLVVTRRKLRRNELTAFFEKQAACTVVMEACGAAHHWARVLTGFGHDVKLIAPDLTPIFHPVATRDRHVLSPSLATVATSRDAASLSPAAYAAGVA